jgi:branched-subunit amino acid ABC-type transport system permease component
VASAGAAEAAPWWPAGDKLCRQLDKGCCALLIGGIVAGYWLQVLVNGATNGLVLALLTSAFAVVYIATNKFHLSLCAVFVAAPATAYGAMQAGLGWLAAVAAAIAVGTALSWLAGALNHERLEIKGASAGAHLISALGLYLVLGQVLVLAGGSETKMLSSKLDPSYTLGPVVVTTGQLLAAGCSVAVLTAFIAFIRWSQIGIRLRALSYNPSECQLRGIDVGQMRRLAFMFAGALGAAGGLLAGRENGYDPNGGLLAGLPAIVALIIGGRQSFLGPIVGAVLVGILRSGTVWCFSAGWREPATFLVLVAFLLLRPNGIFERPGSWEVGS